MKGADLCVAPLNVEEAAKIATLMAVSGWAAVALEYSACRDDVIKAFRDAGLEVYCRATIEARDARTLLEKVKQVRNHVDIVAVKPKSEEVMRYAARDDRIDLVVVQRGYAKLVDRSQARLHRIGGGAIEVQLSSVFAKGGEALRFLMVVARRASAYNVPLVLSTCSTTVWDVVAVKTIEALLETIGIPKSRAFEIIYANPWYVIKQALRKRGVNI